MDEPQSEKNRKHLLERPWIKGFWMPLTVALIAGVVLLTLPSVRPLVFRALGRFCIWLYHAQVPLVLFLTVLAVEVIILLLRKRRQASIEAKGRLTKGAGPEMPVLETIDQRIKEVRQEIPALTEEHYLVLIALAGGKDSLEDGPLFKTYIRYFPKKSRLYFNLVIDDLEQRKLINVTPNYSGEKFYTILPKGRDIVRGLLKQVRESQQQEAETGPSHSQEK